MEQLPDTPPEHQLQTSPELVKVDTAFTVLAQVNLLAESNALALDIGGSLAKLIYLQPHSAHKSTPPPLKIHVVDGSVASALSVPVPVLNGTLHFFAFETRNIHTLLRFIRKHWALKNSPHRQIRATGGGAYKYDATFRKEIDVTLTRLDEMSCAVAGLNFLLTSVDNEVYIYRPPSTKSIPRHPSPTPPDLASARHFVHSNQNPFPYLLVNIGSGVSIVKVTAHDQFERVSGSSLGGGTFWGLSRMLLDCNSFDDVINLTNIGDNSNVDMLVGDIYGRSYHSLGLDASVIAASFGKATMRSDHQTPSASSDFQSIRAHHTTDASPPSFWTNLKNRIRRAVSGTTALWMHAFSAVPPIGYILHKFGLSTDLMIEEITATEDSANCHGPTSASQRPTSAQATRNQFRPQDIALALLRMVSYNIGQIAHLNARVHGLERIYFGGNFVRNHPYTIADISFAVNFWSGGKMEALFLRHDGYLGAIGAFINASSASPTKIIDEQFALSLPNQTHERQPQFEDEVLKLSPSFNTTITNGPVDRTAESGTVSSLPAKEDPVIPAKCDEADPAPVAPSGTVNASTVASEPLNRSKDSSPTLAAPLANGKIPEAVSKVLPAKNEELSSVSSPGTSSLNIPASAPLNGENGSAHSTPTRNGTATANGHSKRKKRSSGKGKGTANGTAVTSNGLSGTVDDAKLSAAVRTAQLLAPSSSVVVDNSSEDGWTTVTRIRRRGAHKA